MERKTLWMPPAYMISLGTYFRVLGSTSLSDARFFSSLWSLGVLAVSYFLGRRLGLSHLQSLVSSIFLSLDIVFFRISYMARMESMCLFFALLSLCTASKLEDEASRKKSLFYAAITGIFLGISFLSHPFGAVYGVVVLYFLLSSAHRFQNVVMTTFFGALSLFPWIWYIHPDWSLFQIQFGAQFGRKKELFETIGLITKLKIFFSPWYIPALKLLSVVVITILSCFYLPNLFLIFYFVVISTFLFLSTEYYYAIHLVVPFAFLVAWFWRLGFRKYVVGIFLLQIIFLGSNLYRSQIQNQYSRKVEQLFQETAKTFKNPKTIYLHAVPDPYFYLQENLPNARLYEFLPGEISLDSAFYEKKIKTFDAYIFYNTDLMNPSLKEYLGNPKQFRKTKVVVPQNSKEPNLELTIYQKF